MPYDTQNITIVSACKEELAVIAALAGKIWPAAYGSILDEGQIRYMLKMMYDLPVLENEYEEGVRFDLILDGGNPVGFASYGPCKEFSDCAKLHKIYLDAAYHNRGIGTLTLRHIINETRQAGYRVLRLNVNRNNTAAIRAYERNGFQVLQETVTNIGHGYVMDDFVMENQLSGD